MSFQIGAADERAAIVTFLRTKTNLRALASLIEDGLHRASAKDLEAFCKRRQVKVK